MRVAVQGGQPTAIAPGADNAMLAVDSEGSVYWPAGGGTTKLGVGGAPTPLVPPSNAHIPQLVVGPDAVFWIALDKTPLTSRVMKIGRNGGASTQLAAVPAAVNA